MPDTIADLRRYRGAIPFIPFVLHLKSEELVRVGAPEHIAYAEGGSQCTVYEGRDFRFIQLSDVVAIDQVLETQPVRRKRLSVAAYEQTAADGILPETSRLELIEGRIVEKDWMSPPSACAGEKCREVLDRVVPLGWYVRECGPVRIPSRDSEPEPEVSVVRGQPGAYWERHPGPEDVALVVEVVRWDVAEERRLAATYGGGGIPVYWIVNVADRQLEVYGPAIAGAYPAPTILGETESVEVIIDGQVVGTIAVASLLPRSRKEATP